MTGYHEVRAVLRSPHLSSDPTRPGMPRLTRGPQHVPPGFFIQLDDPEHARLRRMLTREFMVKRIAALRPRIVEVVRDQLERLATRPPPADLVAEFALPIPAGVFAELLGVPPRHADRFRTWSQTLLTLTADAEQTAEAGEGLWRLLGDLAEYRTAEPRDDLLSRLVIDREGSAEIDRETAVNLAMLLVVAGHDTAATMIGMGVLALLDHPEQLRRWRDRPERHTGAVEELLRYLTPIHNGLPRVAVADIEVGGQVIRAGEGLVINLMSANRDHRAFGRPNSVDLTRDARAHLAFGYGVHQCLGQSLARAMLQVALPMLFERLPALRLAAPVRELRFRQHMTVFGVHHLPVTW